MQFRLFLGCVLMISSFFFFVGAIMVKSKNKEINGLKIERERERQRKRVKVVPKPHKIKFYINKKNKVF